MSTRLPGGRGVNRHATSRRRVPLATGPIRPTIHNAPVGRDATRDTPAFSLSRRNDFRFVEFPRGPASPTFGGRGSTGSTGGLPDAPDLGRNNLRRDVASNRSADPSRSSDRTLRGSWTARTGRDGDGLPGQAPPSRPTDRSQDPSGADRPAVGCSRPVPTGNEGDRPDLEPPNRPGL